MAQPVEFVGANKSLAAPEGMEKVVQPLPVFSNGITTISCWQLSPEEMRQIHDSGGKVFLSIMSGPSQPPCYVGSKESVLIVNAPFGNWK